MRLIVAALAVVALIKIYTQDQIYRTATSHALIDAYRTRAINACQSDRLKQSAQLSRILWDEPGSIQVEIGRSDLGIRVWETNHALWEAAYMQPYLVLFPSNTRTGLKCTYDITAGAANIAQS